MLLLVQLRNEQLAAEQLPEVNGALVPNYGYWLHHNKAYLLGPYGGVSLEAKMRELASLQLFYQQAMLLGQMSAQLYMEQTCRLQAQRRHMALKTLCVSLEAIQAFARLVCVLMGALIDLV